MLLTVEDRYRIVVTLDTKVAVTTVRDELIERLLVRNSLADPEWTVDQLTQETIGTTLAEQGWEVVAHQPQPVSAEWSPPTATYLVRG
jgi:hypothetical protein